MAQANTPAEINEMFDGISYGKGGAVLSMVENYLGKETFRQGVHNYLMAHMYGNATAEDFWNAQTATSKKPVDKIMASLIASARGSAADLQRCEQEQRAGGAEPLLSRSDHPAGNVTDMDAAGLLQVGRGLLVRAACVAASKSCGSRGRAFCSRMRGRGATTASCIRRRSTRTSSHTWRAV